MWNVDPHDWEYKKENQENIDRIVQSVLDNVKDGDIILMHDIYSSSVEAALDIVDGLQARGYRFVTVQQLLELRGIEAEPGAVYRSVPAG